MQHEGGNGWKLRKVVSYKNVCRELILFPQHTTCVANSVRSGPPSRAHTFNGHARNEILFIFDSPTCVVLDVCLQSGAQMCPVPVLLRVSFWCCLCPCHFVCFSSKLCICLPPSATPPPAPLSPIYSSLTSFFAFFSPLLHSASKASRSYSPYGVSIISPYWFPPTPVTFLPLVLVFIPANSLSRPLRR